MLSLLEGQQAGSSAENDARVPRGTLAACEVRK